MQKYLAQKHLFSGYKKRTYVSLSNNVGFSTDYSSSTNRDLKLSDPLLKILVVAKRIYLKKLKEAYTHKEKK